MRVTEPSKIVKCPHPDCDFEVGDPTKLRSFLKASEHADEEHGPEVKFVRREGCGWVLSYSSQE